MYLLRGLVQITADKKRPDIGCWNTACWYAADFRFLFVVDLVLMLVILFTQLWPRSRALKTTEVDRLPRFVDLRPTSGATMIELVPSNCVTSLQQTPFESPSNVQSFERASWGETKAEHPIKDLHTSFPGHFVVSFFVEN